MVPTESASLTTSSLWASIRDEVELRFWFSLPSEVESVIHPAALLRGICLSVGIQLIAHDYRFWGSPCFESDHVVSLYPTSRIALRKEMHVVHAWESLLDDLNSSNADELVVGLEAMQRVYGVLHEDVARCLLYACSFIRAIAY